ncbi:hypothetical protein ACLOJK_005835 [Asimina triloba]
MKLAIFQGKVKQIVGSTLRDSTEDAAALITNFESDKSAAEFANLYREDGLTGGHVIMLGADASSKSAAIEALRAYPGGLQVGGGINLDNALDYLEEGASHVIVTSYVFNGGKMDLDRLKQLVNTIGKRRLVLDLSCRKKDGEYVIVTDRWQKFSDVYLDEKTLDFLASYADEFLVHGVDVEGKRLGIDEDLAALLGQFSPVRNSPPILSSADFFDEMFAVILVLSFGLSQIPVTYAGGVTTIEDLEMIKAAGKGCVDVTVGSALDIFGGDLAYKGIVAWHEEQQQQPMTRLGIDKEYDNCPHATEERPEFSLIHLQDLRSSHGMPLGKEIVFQDYAYWHEGGILLVDYEDCLHDHVLELLMGWSLLLILQFLVMVDGLQGMSNRSTVGLVGIHATHVIRLRLRLILPPVGQSLKKKRYSSVFSSHRPAPSPTFLGTPKQDRSTFHFSLSTTTYMANYKLKVEQILCVAALLHTFASPVTHAGDPDILSDFTLPPNTTVVDGNYFTYTAFRAALLQAQPNSPSQKKFTVTKTSLVEFPALAGQSVSYATLRYAAGSLNPPHTHPRSAELLLLLRGSLQVGFVDTANKLYAQTLYAGDMFVFPKGLMHYQYNSDNDERSLPALAVSAFGSANAGTVSLPWTLFATGIDEAVLAAAFRTDIPTVQKLKAAIASSP